MSLPTPSETVGKLQTSLQTKAKAEPAFRFYALWDKVCRKDVLQEAYRRCRANAGAAGVDGQTFGQIDAQGPERWLGELQEELMSGRYIPGPLLRVWIPKSNGGQRPLGIPTIRDRVVQMAAVLIIGPIFETDLLPQQYGFRPGLDAKMALRRVHWHVTQHGRREVVDADLRDYFTSIPHSPLLRSLSRRISDGRIVNRRPKLALTQSRCNWERSWGENVRWMVFMARGISLAPAGLVVERLETTADRITVLARPASETAACPNCTQVSRSVHSRYQRSLSDLPSDGRAVQIKIKVRRFRCRQADCARRVFAERLDPAVTTAFSRRTERLEGIVHHLGLALGGRPGQSFARRLVIPVSKDTLLRVVRRRTAVPISAPRVVGIDDWAWKRGHRYGTIICDLEQRRIVDILPDREAATVAAWLAEHPSITIIARDRGAGFVQAATQGRPEAVQVADRWHLMENASAAFLGAIKQSMRMIRKAFGAGVVDPALLTSAETRQYDGWVRREDENAAVLALAKAGVPIKEIVRRTGKSRGIVRQIVRGGRTDVFRNRMSSLDPFTKQLETEWKSGCRNGSELWRHLKAAGFVGSLRVVTEWTTRRRRDADATSVAAGPQKTPSARSIARLMTTERSRPSKEGARAMAIIEGAVPDLVVARDLTDRFHQMVQRRMHSGLEPWIADATPSMMASFASGITRDQAAVQAALQQPWSNGQTEGQNTKLKLVKRQMYGRANLDLLRARLVAAA